ncbi:hypothetical protein WDW89_10155 [Deltaproteobacteria bacterium TL4]
MWEDPIVNEVRQVRHKIEEECGFDMTKLLERAKKLEIQYQSRVISRQPVSLGTVASR